MNFKKITGLFSFISSIILLCILIYGIVHSIGKENENDIETLFIVGLVAIFLVSNLIYIRKTNFGNPEKSEIDKLSSENKILQIKIEQKELMKKLNE